MIIQQVSPVKFFTGLMLGFFNCNQKDSPSQRGLSLSFEIAGFFGNAAYSLLFSSLKPKLNRPIVFLSFFHLLFFSRYTTKGER